MLRKVYITTDFLHGFTKPDEYKILTHGFDPNYPNDFYYYVNRLRQDLIVRQGLIPNTLYDLLFGFCFGPSWRDANGVDHIGNCASEQWFEWCKSNPGKHPKDCFSKDFIDFKNSIRIYSPDFADYVDRLVEENQFPSLNLTQNGLEDFDSYLDVGRLHFVIEQILRLMSEVKHASHPSVQFGLSRGKNNGFDVETIIIEQVGSFCSKPLIDVIAHYKRGGGDLATIGNSMQDYFGWSIETRWGDSCQRWNIIRDEAMPETECVSPSLTTGFRHLIKVYHKP